MYSTSTIEPRLIALLNEGQQSLPSPSLELPPLQDPNILKASGRPLLLEPDATTRNGKSTSSKLASQHSTIIAPIGEDDNIALNHGARKKAGKTVLGGDRALGDSSPQSLRKILDDDVVEDTPASTKKRHIPNSTKDDFVQLPKPPKKHKAAKQVVPPIIIGLFEPPPQSTLFPPIASSSFHDSHGRNSLNTVLPRPKTAEGHASLDISPSTTEKSQKGKSPTKPGKKKDVKARKKWTEEETNHLLLGVHKHGVGKWTQILQDSAYSFNGRTGVDLKDRFRTCCPDELRGKKSKHSPTSDENHGSKGKVSETTPNTFSANSNTDEDGKGCGFGQNEGSTAASFTGKTLKPRAHRKRLEDLEQLGIDGPFRKSGRRERRPFTEEDDAEILDGYNLYGPAWTRIQRDSRFHLQSRKPTDLRDRFRNKYPERFRSGEEAKEAQKPADQRLDTGKPLIALASSSSLPSASRERLKIQQMISAQESDTSIKINSAALLQSQIPSAAGFKDSLGLISENQVSAESAEALNFSQSFDWNETITAPFSGIGEMDISRFLDQPWDNDLPSLSGKHKRSYTGMNGMMNSTTDYNIFGDSMGNITSSLTLDQDSSFGP